MSRKRSRPQGSRRPLDRTAVPAPQADLFDQPRAPEPPAAQSGEAPETPPAPAAGRSARPLRILWVGTKSPWPPTDGGRLVALETVRALAEAGHQVVFVAPVEGTHEERQTVAEALRPWCEPVLTKPRRRPAFDDAVRAVVGRQPVTVRRHFRAKVAAAVAGRLSTGAFDVVHCEQVHAATQAAPAVALGVPVVLRQQNVESDLWTMLARHNRLLRPLLVLEAARVRRYEAQVMRRMALTVALTGRDAERLRSIAGPRAEVRAVRAPFPGGLEPGDEILAGDPAVVLFGDQRWQPNRLQTLEFVGAMWRRIVAALPEARLHLMGGALRRPVAGVTVHPAPADSRAAYAPGSILAVPLRVASGVRMKILEAWSRGVPVVATSAAAGGLDAEDGRELLLADDADGFVRALARVDGEPGLRAALVAAGRRALAERHQPAAIAAELADAYAFAIARGA